MSSEKPSTEEPWPESSKEPGTEEPRPGSSEERRQRVCRARHIVVVLAVATLILTAACGSLLVALIALRLPDLSSVAHYQPSQTTRIYDRHGSLIASVFEENRIVIPLSAM
ncbi:MAG TPA: hypothetical protein VLR45_02965, partial [Desulfoprunum sp.]|nr:hypothetical protein [Desulfoprunum sp.]